MKKSKTANRKKIKSSSDRLRLSVFRSNLNIFAQIIDDVKGVTLASASSLKLKDASGIQAAKFVGEEIAKKAKEKNIEKIVFDRGSYLYAGRMKALADSARENGLIF